MFNNHHVQDTTFVFNLDGFLETWVEAFMMDRKAQNIAKGTLHYYRFRLKEFVAYCETR